jgi:2'-5' RNA ligase
MRKPPSIVRELGRRVVSRARRSLGFENASTLARPEIAYVLPLGDEAHNFMTQLQVDISRRHGGLNDGMTAPPHITLKLGFRTPDLAQFAGYLDEVAQSTPAFEVSLSGISSFEEGIIFLDVEPNPTLDQLRRRIVRELSDRFQVEPKPLEDHRFHFHATLAYGLPPTAFEEELARLSPLTPRFRFEARTLAMLVHTGEHWVTYRRTALV